MKPALRYLFCPACSSLSVAEFWRFQIAAYDLPVQYTFGICPVCAYRHAPPPEVLSIAAVAVGLFAEQHRSTAA